MNESNSNKNMTNKDKFHITMSLAIVSFLVVGVISINLIIKLTTEEEANNMPLYIMILIFGAINLVFAGFAIKYYKAKEN